MSVEGGTILKAAVEMAYQSFQYLQRVRSDFECITNLKTHDIPQEFVGLSRFEAKYQISLNEEDLDLIG